MQMNDVDYGGGVPIDGYGPAGFRVGGVMHGGAVLVRPGGPVAWGGFEDAQTLLAARPVIDVLLIGTGAEIAPIPDALRAALEADGMGVEIMGSGPACRTYNVLLGEGRRIGAALLPV